MPARLSRGSDSLVSMFLREKPLETNSYAITFPVASSAARPRCTDAGPFGSQAMPSFLMPCTRTGRPVSLESSAASSAASPASLRP